MEGIKDVKDLLQEGDLMTSWDLKDAFLHLLYRKDFRKYCAFRWDGKYWKCISCLFGQTHVPRWWTKIMNVISKFLRRHAIRCIIYIDDILCFHGPDRRKALEERQFVYELLCRLGLTINIVKSNSNPTTRLEYLGYIIDSVRMKLFAPRRKIRDVVKLARKLRRDVLSPWRLLATFLGKVSSLSHAILPWRLWTRGLVIDKNDVLRSTGSYDALVSLSSPALKNLDLWIDLIKFFNGRDVRTPHPSWTTCSDSSPTAFAEKSGSWLLIQDWSKELSLEHNNFLETFGSVETIRQFVIQKDISNGVLLHRTDNTVAVSYLNKQGGRVQKISQPVEEVWTFCLERGIEITASHIPGSDLLDGVDFLSRMGDKQSEWSLPRTVFLEIQSLWGPFQYDLFATQFNTQLQNFMSFWKDPHAFALDALNQPWPHNCYAFPPFCLIGRILVKMMQDSVDSLILITPLWEGATWWPVIHSLAVEIPMILPPVLFNLKNVPQNLKWNLLAWRLSCDRSKSLVLTSMCSDWWTQRGEIPRPLIPSGEFLQIGVNPAM